MRIFISHSSKDRWIAERIKEDLEEIQMKDRRVTAFLSSDDIEIGQRFEDVIDEALSECDGIAVLVSSASRASAWVIYEATVWRERKEGRDKKHIVGILVSGTLPPDPLRRIQCIELNAVQDFYVTAEGWLREWVPPTPDPSDQAIEKGDRVRIKVPDTDAAREGPPRWRTAMEGHGLKVAKVLEANPRRKTARLDVDNKAFLWAFRWLEKI